MARGLSFRAALKLLHESAMEGLATLRQANRLKSIFRVSEVQVQSYSCELLKSSSDKSYDDGVTRRIVSPSGPAE